MDMEYFKKYLDEKFNSLDERFDSFEDKVFGEDSPLQKKSDCIIFRTAYDGYINRIKGGWWTALKVCAILLAGTGLCAAVISIGLKVYK